MFRTSTDSHRMPPTVPPPFHSRHRRAEPGRSGRTKRGPARHCPEAHPGRSKGLHPRTVLTALGRVTLQRSYFACAACGQGEFGADRLLGLDGYVTAGARRMACLLGVQQSFTKAELALAEVAGWDLDDNTIRQLCHPTATDVSASRAERSSAERFGAASGDRELQMDAGTANTLED
jgi:hypothetical protein